MRTNGRGAGLGVAGLVGLLVVAGCASAGGGAAAARRTTEDPGLAEARAAIARRIATTVGAIERKDVDALLGNVDVNWKGADGHTLTKAEVREVVRREWAPIERTVELTVQIDSVNMVSDAAALVYTNQLWHRIVVGSDGKRHDVTTASEIAQAWGRTGDDWRGTGPARLLRASTRVDGREVSGGAGVLASRP